MSRELFPMRRLARLLVCVIMLFGTTGAATADALLHAGDLHGHHHESGSGTDAQGSCVLCVAAAAAASLPHGAAGSCLALAMLPGTVRPSSEPLVREPAWLAPPGRAPPAC